MDTKYLLFLFPLITCAHEQYCGNPIGSKGIVEKEKLARFGEFPWMLAILKKYPEPGDNKMICGGSLIAPNIVLTTANCTTKFNSSNAIVRGGEWNSLRDTELFSYQEKFIKDIIVHEKFAHKNLASDVAVIILESPFDLLVQIGTVCLPEQGMVRSAKQCYVSSWDVSKFGNEKKENGILEKHAVGLLLKKTCQAELRKTRLGPKFTLDDSFVCIEANRGTETHSTPDGSPLVCEDPEHPKRYIQFGMTSWSTNGYRTKIGGVYANVANFRLWIDQQLAKY